jgi:selenocysteine lyase/cysteine desulfurase
VINRKKFLLQIGAASMLMPLSSACGNKKDIEPPLSLPEDVSQKNLPHDDIFWQQMSNHFRQGEGIINLNNAAVSPQPLWVEKTMVENHVFSNSAPSYFMWRKLNEKREILRQQLAEMLDCTASELAINRNTTEGLSTVIFGMNLRAGDEVVVSNMDYPNALDAWQQRSLRDRLVLKTVMLNCPEENEEELVAKFVAAITHKTKVIHLTHVINWTGQILPVEKITIESKKRGCEVVVDGAHSFAHIDFNLKKIGCDYYATSLHKWLCAPFGTGLLFVAKDKIASTYPLLGSGEPLSSDMKKFESLGTRSFATEMAVLSAIEFHQRIGTQNKFNRLTFLKNGLIKRLAKFQRIAILSSVNSRFNAGFCTFRIEGLNNYEVEQKLLNEYDFHTSPVYHNNLNAIRVSPHIYTREEEIEKFVEAVEKIMA